jgi:polysaccharide pyruvyl transferase WcaK-like protein
MNLITKTKYFYTSAYKMGHFPSLLTLLFSKKRIFVYYGFLGDNNYGDELVYEATKEIFKSHILVPVRRRMPIALRLYLTLRKENIAGIVVGGGTLISKFMEADFYKSLVQMNKPVYLHGTGVHAEIKDKKTWSIILDKGFFGGVRGPLSVKNLKVIAAPVKIMGDAAFGIDSPLKIVKNGESRKVLINLGTHAPYEGQDFFRHEFNSFIEHLFLHHYEVCYLPFHAIDLALGLELKKTYPNIQILEQPVGFNECSLLFSDAIFAIGERLHFVVMALMTSTPFTSINYAKKHDDLLLSLSLAQQGLIPGEAALESLIKGFDTRHSMDWNDTQKRIEKYRNLQISEMKNFVESTVV